MQETRIELTIISDGTGPGTFIKDQDGRALDNVINYKFELGVNGEALTHLTLVGVPTKIDYPANITTLEQLSTIDFPSTTLISEEAKSLQESNAHAN